MAEMVGPRVSPRPMPMADMPMAMPIFGPLNHIPTVLVTLTGTTSLTTPLRKTVIARVRKLLERPRSAPVTPTRMQNRLKMNFTPKRSLNKPAKMLTKTPARLEMPQMVPIWTRLKPRSSEISLKRTGIQEKGKAATNVPVPVNRASMYHR